MKMFEEDPVDMMVLIVVLLTAVTKNVYATKRPICAHNQADTDPSEGHRDLL